MLRQLALRAGRVAPGLGPRWGRGPPWQLQAQNSNDLGLDANKLGKILPVCSTLLAQAGSTLCVLVACRDRVGSGRRLGQLL